MAAGPVTLREILCLALTIFLEARGEPTSGQYLVGAVVLNRVHAEEYPDTVCDVVNQPNQFATEIKSSGTPEEIRSAARVALDLYYNYEPNAELLWFYDPDKANPDWAKHLQPAFKIGSHLFLRKKS